jgi:hypothetical protein
VASSLLANSNCFALVSDVFSGYAKAVRVANKLRPETKQIINAYCNAHARRKFVDAQHAFPNEAKFYIDIYRDIYAVESQMPLFSEAGQIQSRLELYEHFSKMQTQTEVDLKKVSVKSSLAKRDFLFHCKFSRAHRMHTLSRSATGQQPSGTSVAKASHRPKNLVRNALKTRSLNRRSTFYDRAVGKAL